MQIRVNWQCAGLSALKEAGRGETRPRSKEVVRCDRRLEHLHNNNISVTVFLPLTFALWKLLETFVKLGDNKPGMSICWLPRCWDEAEED